MIELSVPATPGRMIEVGQTVEAEGYVVTLDQVVIAPSVISARYTLELNPTEWVWDYLKIADWPMSPVTGFLNWMCTSKEKNACSANQN